MEGSTAVARVLTPRKLRTKRGHQNSRVTTYCRTLRLGKKDFGCPYNLRPSNYSGDICLRSGDGDGDSKRYAEEVVRKNPDLELVEAGPLALGHGVKGRIVHMNFKAKRKEKSVVETYFAELTITNRDAVVVNRVANLGSTDSLPEIADTDACLYCCSHNNIHHPDSYLHPFRCGRERHLATLTYQVKQLHDFITKGEQLVGFNPRFSHPGVKYISKHSRWKKQLSEILEPEDRDLTEHANLALSLFNGLEGKNFVLVKIGDYEELRFTRLGTVIHFNFEAVNQDYPGDLVQTFFAEVICTTEFLFADFCKCLGPSVLLPGEVALHGCLICSLIHHPPGLGYLTGQEYVEDS
ncbi:Ribose-phosphate pyrophosphokinase [Bienertia sinuspersici]